MTRANPDNAGVIAPPPLIFGIPLAIALYENQSKPFAILDPRYGRISGVALIAVGLVLMAAAMIQFLRAHTAIVPNRPTTALVDSWPYSMSRNPIYLALTIVYVGISLFFDTLWPFLLLPLVLIVMQRGVIDREERYLEGKFGDDYIDYKTRVRRWL
ncbi:MAG: isoprenylcysteine carboxylmethyltransferase family protein [Gemmatimonadaceae bacterium]